MTNLYLFLSKVDSFVEVYSFQIIRFLWQSSVLITGVWIVCRILDNDNPRIKSTLWILAFLVVPLLPLASIIIASDNPWNIAIEFDAQTSIGSILHDTGIIVPENDSLTKQPIHTEETDTKKTMILKDHMRAIAVLFYCMGLCVMVVVFMVKIIRVHHWRKRGYAISTFTVKENVRSLVTIKRLHRSIAVYHSVDVKVPMVVGIINPTILIPSAHLERLEKKALDVVLAHEYAHIARHDNLFLLYASLVQIVLFFHPLVWFAVNRLALSMEEAADYAVLVTTGIDSHEYASVLYSIAALNPVSTPALPFSRNHNLLNRITNILNFTRNGSTMKKVKQYCLLAITGSLLTIGLLVNVTCSTPSVAKESQQSHGIYMTVFGTVTDPHGNTVAGVVVDAVREVPGPYNFGSSLTGDCRFMASTDSTGTFRLSFPEKVNQGSDTPFTKLVRRGTSRDGGIVLIAHAGNKWMHAQDHRWLPGLANGLSRPIKLARGEHGPFTIRLTEDATISGIVVDKDNRPVPEREVRVAYQDGHYDRYFRPAAVTDEAGRFTLSNVEPGKAWIVATDHPVLVYTGAWPYPENTLVTLDISENSAIDGLILRGLSDDENQAIRASVPAKLRSKGFQIW